MPDSRLRTIIMHVEDLPGVLNRVTSLFRRRGYNIDSLTVGRTEVPGVSRMTIVMEADDDAARRIEANLYKLVNVLRVEDTSRRSSVTRELALIKVRAGAATRPRVLQVCDVFGARVIDMTADQLTVELTATHDKIDDLVGVLGADAVLEMVRTGVVAMTRGEPRTIPQLQPQLHPPQSLPSESHEAHDPQGTSPWPESSTTATPISA